jgi:hypothetical protein
VPTPRKGVFSRTAAFLQTTGEMRAQEERRVLGVPAALTGQLQRRWLFNGTKHGRTTPAQMRQMYRHLDHT